MSMYLGTLQAPGLDPAAPEAAPARLQVDPRTLTTHAVCLGMTGSGKTGLCVTLLEEAARAGVPVLAIDPKGDLANLALSWPDLPAERFAEWLPPDAPEDGESVATRWREGLAASGLGPDEIRQLRERAAITVYTPGSSASVPVKLLDRFDPPAGWADLGAEDRAEQVSGVVSALLELVGVDADPLQSREHILLSNLVTHHWQRGQGATLADLVRGLERPPFTRLGALELDTFFPERARVQLATRLNTLLASPSFAPWREGAPLDLDRLLAREAGAARTSVFHLAHLGDAERMSFVTLLLERLVAWMRRQPGSGDLRALLYFDEVFGFLPPHPRNPSSKQPLLTLLKQARAAGLGVVLATQNPVDLDYKALSNAGTWLVGKLQTDQDRDRILDGLVTAEATGAPNADRASLGRLLAGLERRQFLLHAGWLDRPQVFRSRFAMSYLRGPLTRAELGRLRQAGFYNLSQAPEPILAEQAPEAAPNRSGSPSPSAAPQVQLHPPTRRPAPLASTPEPRRTSATTLPQRFLLPEALDDPAIRHAVQLPVVSLTDPRAPLYHPALLATAQVRWRPADHPRQTLTVTRLAPLADRPQALVWSAPLTLDDRLVTQAAPDGALLDPLPPWLSGPEGAPLVLRQRFADGLLASPLMVPYCARWKGGGRYGELGQTLDAFRASLVDELRVMGERTRHAAGERLTHEAALWDRRLAEHQEGLAMAKRELEALAAQGVTGPRLDRARDGARLQLEKYRQTKQMRDASLGEVQREAAELELTAVDLLAACRLAPVHVDRSRVEVTRLELLWVPE